MNVDVLAGFDGRRGASDRLAVFPNQFARGDGAQRNFVARRDGRPRDYTRLLREFQHRAGRHVAQANGDVIVVFETQGGSVARECHVER
jgi:hypothetical protein